uniref:Uncharacterized protein n=1 Tax=Aegilops tauschii TaxID=37682 RepID=R7WGM8_AEGTA
MASESILSCSRIPQLVMYRASASSTTVPILMRSCCNLSTTFSCGCAWLEEWYLFTRKEINRLTSSLATAEMATSMGRIDKVPLAQGPGKGPAKRQ